MRIFTALICIGIWKYALAVEEESKLATLEPSNSSLLIELANVTSHVTSDATSFSDVTENSTNSSSTESEGVFISEQDESPIVSLPRSSEEISNDPTGTEDPEEISPSPSLAIEEESSSTSGYSTHQPSSVDSSSGYSTPQSPSTAGPSSSLKPKKKKKTTKRPLSELLARALKNNSTLVTRISLNNESDPNSNLTLENVNDEFTSTTTNSPDTSASASASAQKEPIVPTLVKNPRVTVIGFTGKPVHSFNLTENQILYQVRVFWMEPDAWNDRGAKPPNRLYDLFCWLSNDGTWIRDLLRQNFSSAIFSHSQWFALPELEKSIKANYTLDCGLRPINSAQKPGDWNFNAPFELRRAPVLLRDFDYINVQGWSEDEISHFTKNNVDKRRDSPQQQPGQNLRKSNDECRQKRQ